MADRRLGMSHASKNMGQVDMLQLGCAVARQLEIEVLASSSKGLQPVRCLAQQTLLTFEDDDGAAPGREDLREVNRHAARLARIAAVGGVTRPFPGRRPTLLVGAQAF